jgi:hypothetical protein
MLLLAYPSHVNILCCQVAPQALEIGLRWLFGSDQKSSWRLTTPFSVLSCASADCSQYRTLVRSCLLSLATGDPSLPPKTPNCVVPVSGR